MARWLTPVLAGWLVSATLPGLVLAQQPQPFPRPAESSRPPADQPEPRRSPEPDRSPPRDTDRDEVIPEEKPVTGREVATPRTAGRSDPAQLPRAQAAEGAAEDGLFPKEATPSAMTLGFPVFSGARFIKSYSAGQGQRYYLFGTTASFDEVVSFYRDALRKRGNKVFDAPPVHRFEEGRFDENRMAFPPSVTVSDFTWGNAKGYLDPQPDGEAFRHPTVIQIVPTPRGAER